MRLSRLHIRFFRSFNYDYELRSHPDSKERSWELIEGGWWPYIEVDLEPTVTAVVGANESGKSHLIDAVEIALTGEGINRNDFCRYSSLYSVETDERREPDFGLEFILNDEDQDLLAQGPIEVESGERLRLFRAGGERSLLRISGEEVAAGDEALDALEARLPRAFRLKTDVPIPDSISLDVLVGRDLQPLSDRSRRARFLDFIAGLGVDSIVEKKDELSDLLDVPPAQGSPEERLRLASHELGKTLLLDVARIERSAFVDLERALKEGREGRVGGLIERMNRSLAKHLNFSKWWSQDSDFQIRIEPRERELAFVIRDRTGTDYSFAERSRGLRYFLSYFVQLKAHRLTQVEGRREILLMDEPDAYLSSAGQQDLLRILEDFAVPEEGARQDQVLYVTHSPFLINKNAAHRIRVIDKGSNEEGTRVVADASRTHYEPLRSSIGAHVAETAFIGGLNIVVEGPADQVLLTGLTSLLRFRQPYQPGLVDLNEVTIVPAGGADNVPIHDLSRQGARSDQAAMHRFARQ